MAGIASFSVNTVLLVAFLARNPKVAVGRAVRSASVYALRLALISVLAAAPLVLLGGRIAAPSAGRGRLVSYGLPLAISTLLHAAVGIGLLALTKDEQAKAVVRAFRRRGRKPNPPAGSCIGSPARTEFAMDSTQGGEGKNSTISSPCRWNSRASPRRAPQRKRIEAVRIPRASCERFRYGIIHDKESCATMVSSAHAGGSNPWIQPCSQQNSTFLRPALKLSKERN